MTDTSHLRSNVSRVSTAPQMLQISVSDDDRPNNLRDQVAQRPSTAGRVNVEELTVLYRTWCCGTVIVSDFHDTSALVTYFRIKITYMLLPNIYFNLLFLLLNRSLAAEDRHFL